MLKSTWVESGFSIPVSGVRKDLVVLRGSYPSYYVVIIEGTQTSYPDAEPGDMPICYVYLRAGQTRIVSFTDKDNYPADGFIEADVRPFLRSESKRYNITEGGDYPTEVTIDGSELTAESWIDFFVRHAVGGSRRQIAQMNYSGLQLYAAGVLAGARINEFSTDGTFSDNSDSAVPTEKAVKSYVDSKLIRHFLNGGLVTVSGNNLIVEPAFLWLAGKTITRSDSVTKDATVSGNYIGTDISAAAGFVYVYAKNDSAGGYDVWLSGDAPNRSDCLDTATGGKLIYRQFGTDWYRFLGARYKSAGSLKACYCTQDGFVQYDSFIEIVSGAVFDGEVNAYLPVTAQRGLFQVEAAYGDGQVIVNIRPSASATDSRKVSCVWSQYDYGFGEIESCATNVAGTMKIYVMWSNGNATYQTKVKTVGYWEVR